MAKRSEAARLENVEEIVLSFSCPNQIGIVHAVAGYFSGLGGDILESQQFDDRLSGTFFLRVHIRLPSDKYTVAELTDGFALIAKQYEMEWTLADAAARPRVAILVSKFGHCLNDLLFRWKSGQLGIEIPVIISNHEDLRPLAETNDIPFEYVPVTAATKPEAEQKLLELVDQYRVDVIVLARYMQILSDDLTQKLQGRAINIHHSFLPSFKGGKPYHQAHARGVKLVGATAHYVTADLDEGPIIEQEVMRVNHSLTAEQLVVAGRDAECMALARAVQWHAEHRVLLNGHRTVVFR